MLPAPGVLLHFSEDPGIVEFRPHVAATARQPEAYVWTVDALNAPCYWFPRQCPRVCHWEAVGSPRPRDRARWLDTMAATTLHAYRFAAADFEPFGERPHAFVSTRQVAAARAADCRSPTCPASTPPHGIELLVLDGLEEHFAAVQEAGHDFSGIRMRNAGLGPDAFASLTPAG